MSFSVRRRVLFTASRVPALPLLVAAVTAAGLVSAVASPASAAPAAGSPLARPSSPVSAARWTTGASSGAPTTVASKSAARHVVGKDGEVAALRTAKSRTYQRDGKFQTVVSTVAVNYRNRAGAWTPIDTTLVAQADGTFDPAADGIEVSLPATSAGVVQASEDDATVNSTLRGAATVPAVISGSTATYTGVYPGVDAVYQVGVDGLSETLILASAAVPASFSSVVTVAAGSTLRPEADRSISVIDSDGTVEGSLPAPVMKDASTDVDRNTSTAVAYAITGSSPTYTVTVTPDRAWITDPARVFPIALDPSVSFGTSNDVGCYVTNPGTGTPPGDPQLCATNSGTDNTLNYGYTAYLRRAYLTFGDLTGTGSAVPADAVIDDAALTLTVSAQSYATAMDTQLLQVTSAWSPTTMTGWSTQPTTNAVQQDRINLTPPGAGNAVTFYPTGLVSQWVHGTAANYGLSIRLVSEVSSVLNTVAFNGFANSAHHPTLTVTWTPALGQQSFVGAYDHQLSDRSDLHVDLADRNLVVNGSDESMTGPGQSLTVRRTYNSLSAAAGATGGFGTGWSMNGGVDTGIAISRGQVTVTAPGGAHGAFTRDFAVASTATVGAYRAAPGWKADLIQPDATHYTLTFRQTHVVDTFTLPASGASTGWLSKVDDGNGNNLVYTASGSPLVTTSETDTTGQRSVGFSYAYGQLISMTETLASGATGARTYNYGYSGTNLVTYTDPAGKITRYCYTGALLTRIVTARGSATGATCATTAGTGVTDVAYDTGGRVTSVTYQNAAGTAITVGFAVGVALPPGGTGGTTTFTDPYGKVTTYSYDTTDRITKTRSPLGYSATSTFNTNNDVTASVSPTNFTGGADPTTTSTYTGDNLTQVSDPTGAAVSAAYSGPETNQPSAVSDDRDPTGGTTGAAKTSYSYNTNGQVSQVSKGTTTVKVLHEGDTGYATHCGPAGAAAYQGAVCETRDGDYSGSLTAEHRTLYAYNALGQVISKTPAQPDHSRSTPPASTYLYDSHSRVTSITDARGKTTTYTYDTLDRLTRTTSNTGRYTAYTWDQDGDKLTVQDYTSAGVRTAGSGDAWTYDPLNRTATETADTHATATLTYDGDSRLLTYNDGGSGGTATYGYNDDGALTSMAEPGGSCTGLTLTSPGAASNKCILFNVDKSGRRLQTMNPGNLSDQYQTYDSAGKVASITTTGQSGGSATTFSTLGYSYQVGTAASRHIATVTDTTNAVHTNYVYTNEGSLQSAKRYNAATGGTLTANWLYCYDGAGNRTYTSTVLTTTTCPGTGLTAYDGANQQLGTSTSYDLSGDETSMTTSLPAASTVRTSSWTDTQQLATTTLNGGTSLASSYFDAGNQMLLSAGVSATDRDDIRNEPLGVSRVARTVSGTETSRYYLERDPAGTIMAIQDATTGNRYYPMSDHLASVTRVVDSAGVTADTYTYDPTGTRTTGTNTYPQAFGYTGAYTNPTTGLVHLGARYYDPTLARFTQPDPQTHPTDTHQNNPYPYTGNDPINNVDPSGNFSFSDVFETASKDAFLGFVGGITAGCLTTGCVASAPEALAGAVGGYVVGLVDGVISQF